MISCARAKSILPRPAPQTVDSMSTRGKDALQEIHYTTPHVSSDQRACSGARACYCRLIDAIMQTQPRRVLLLAHTEPSIHEAISASPPQLTAKLTTTAAPTPPHLALPSDTTQDASSGDHNQATSRPGLVVPPSPVKRFSGPHGWAVCGPTP